jgi:hypothetical protein
MRNLMRALLLPLLLAGPAMAADPVVLILENRSGQMIRYVALYPVGDDGQVVDDVLMTDDDVIAAGATVALDTRLLACGRVMLWVRFGDETEARVQTDLCRNNRLIATP